jgi:hypothetical protein
MPIVMQCRALGCVTLTMGPLCIEHEKQAERLFVRGRPLVRDVMDARRSPVLTRSYVPSLRTASERPGAALTRR